MEYALRLVENEGIEALRKRVSRNEKSFTPAFVSETARQEFCVDVKKNCIYSFTCIMAMVLRDEFGFGTTRMTRYAKKFYDLCDSVADHWLTYNDIVKTIMEETNVDLSPFGDGAKMFLNGVQETLEGKDE